MKTKTTPLTRDELRLLRKEVRHQITTSGWTKLRKTPGTGASARRGLNVSDERAKYIKALATTFIHQ